MSIYLVLLPPAVFIMQICSLLIIKDFVYGMIVGASISWANILHVIIAILYVMWVKSFIDFLVNNDLVF